MIHAAQIQIRRGVVLQLHELLHLSLVQRSLSGSLIRPVQRDPELRWLTYRLCWKLPFWTLGRVPYIVDHIRYVLVFVLYQDLFCDVGRYFLLQVFLLCILDRTLLGQRPLLLSPISFDGVWGLVVWIGTVIIA